MKLWAGLKLNTDEQRDLAACISIALLFVVLLMLLFISNEIAYKQYNQRKVYERKAYSQDNKALQLSTSNEINIMSTEDFERLLSMLEQIDLLLNNGANSEDIQQLRDMYNNMLKMYQAYQFIEYCKQIPNIIWNNIESARIYSMPVQIVQIM